MILQVPQQYEAQKVILQNLILIDQFSIVLQQKLMSKAFAALLLLCLCMLTNAQVTYDSLKAFWEDTYDTDGDGAANINDFAAYFNLMEPEQGITAADCQEIFESFDSNSDKLVTLQQLIRIARIKVTHNPGHKQIHLGLTANAAEMQVIWASNPEHYEEPIVEYGRIPGILKNIAKGTYHTYDIGKVGGFKGRIYVATMKDLDPFKRYFYRVGDSRTRTFSKIKYFTAPPLKNQALEEMNIAVFGDMGTFAPFGALVIDKIAKDNLITPFNVIFLTGDIAYAGMNSQTRGQSAPIWDLFGQLSQKFAAYTAFMPGVGNHQAYYNYTAYFNRYILPRSFPDQTNLYFSFDYGQVHFVHFSSEHPYNNGSEQYNFLEKDLSEARSNPNIQWIIAGAHRTFYSSNLDGYTQKRDLAVHLEELMYRYKVDIVQNGHLHNYERTFPIYKGKAVMRGVNHTHYVDPQAPVYMTQGTAGALIREKYYKPAPGWSASRQNKYGYGKIRIKGDQLKYQFITIPSGRIADQFTIVKTSKQTNQHE